MRKVLIIIITIGFAAAVLRLLEEEAAQDALRNRMEAIREQEARTGEVDPGRELGAYYECE